MVNLLFCGNDRVFDGVLTGTLSALKRSTSKEPYCVYMFTMDLSDLQAQYKPISEAQAACLDRVLKSYNPESRAVRIDITDLYNREFRSCPNESAYCSPYTLIRLFADEIDSLPDKLLYLDADIMFNRDIHLLYDLDVTDYEYAAAPDHYGKYLIHPHYINAGVLLLNLKRMRETGILTRARALIRTKKLVFADQSALIRSTTRRKLLPQKFNDQKYLHRHTVIRHFSKRLFWLPYPHTDNVKQWQVERVHGIFKYHQFDDILNEYLQIIEKNKEGSANG